MIQAMTMRGGSLKVTVVNNVCEAILHVNSKIFIVENWGVSSNASTNEV